MQPARIKPHAKEHTNNPVQRPNFRGHAAGDVEVTRDCGKVPSLPSGSKGAIRSKDGTPHRRGEPRSLHPPRWRCKRPKVRYDELPCVVRRASD
jgi:hypothetical protein